jgi:hypothetical protein
LAGARIEAHEQGKFAQILIVGDGNYKAQIHHTLEQSTSGISICLHARKEAMIGEPDMSVVSTSYVERQNVETLPLGSASTAKYLSLFGSD